MALRARSTIAAAVAAALAVLTLAGAPALAQNAPAAGLVLSGTVASPLSLEALRALPATTLDIAFLTSKGEEKARYTGALLWGVLEANRLVDASRHSASLRQIIRVTGRDGYVVLFSAGEIAPELGGRQILLAYERDGAALPPDKGIRLIVPGDTRGARNVVDVVRIDVTTEETR